QLGGPSPGGGPIETIRQAMDNGIADGVLAPERLLAPTRLAPAMHPATPVPATPENAARLAKAAHAHWTTIYTLRKCPLEGAGIKLIHTGMEAMYGQDKPPANPEALLSGIQTNRFNLSPEDRAAHQRAVDALKKQK